MSLTWQTLSHNRKWQPSSDLIGVIGTRDEVEEHGEWVSGREGDFAHFGSRGTKVAQSDVDAQVAQFAELLKNGSIQG